MATASHIINIHVADTEELQQIPGIGPVLARRILQLRDSMNIESFTPTKVLGLPHMTEEIIEQCSCEFPHQRYTKGSPTGRYSLDGNESDDEGSDREHYPHKRPISRHSDTSRTSLPLHRGQRDTNHNNQIGPQQGNPEPDVILLNLRYRLTSTTMRLITRKGVLTLLFTMNLMIRVDTTFHLLGHTIAAVRRLYCIGGMRIKLRRGTEFHFPNP